MSKKKNIEWTEEDEKKLNELSKKKKLCEKKREIDFVAENLFKLGKHLKNAKTDDDVQGISLVITKNPYSPEDMHFDSKISKTSYEITIPNDIMREINNAK